MSKKDLTTENNQFVTAYKVVATRDIYLNSGQITGLPANPRYIEEIDYTKLLISITEDPEYLYARPLIIVPYAAAYVVIGGNMRLKACIELHILDVPCIILNESTPVDKLKRYLIKDNASSGKWNWDMIANEWDAAQISQWGIDLPYSPPTDADMAGGGGDEGSLKIDNFKLTLDCGEDQATYKQLKTKLESILKGFQGVEMRG